MATPNKSGPKTMSSRLATMKFMQRGTATSPSSSPATPEERGGKRQRLSNGSYNASPASTPGGADDADEQKRQETAEREGVAKGDTKWYLSVQPTSKPVAGSPLKIVSAGYSTLDAAARRSSAPEDEDVGTGAAAGRMNFGNFSRKQTAQKPASADDDDDDDDESGSSSDSDDEEEDDPTGAKALIKQSRKEAGDKVRAERKAKRKSDGAESARLAESRRKKEVNLNKVTSISGAGGGGGRSTPSSVICHACGKKGHIKAECPDAGPRKSRNLNY